MLQLPIAMNFFSFSGSDKISLSLDLVMWEIWLPFSMPISMIKGKLSLPFLDFAAPPDGTRLDSRVPKAVIAFFNSAVATRVADASSTKGFRSAVLALACSRLTCCNRPREAKPQAPDCATMSRNMIKEKNIYIDVDSITSITNEQ